ncbi:hypothetical protein CGMCC3_g12140 [Colletotrichum fructicola]|nr:uncharacterized protein CGMCC3_g12140 [Colletotrichum fructicola]KAE9571731.1 hypothetical protein CGMCC3_g12140 [Colletotrichum fructicola]
MELLSYLSNMSSVICRSVCFRANKESIPGRWASNRNTQAQKAVYDVRDFRKNSFDFVTVRVFRVITQVCVVFYPRDAFENLL